MGWAIDEKSFQIDPDHCRIFCNKMRPAGSQCPYIDDASTVLRSMRATRIDDIQLWQGSQWRWPSLSRAGKIAATQPAMQWIPLPSQLFKCDRKSPLVNILTFADLFQYSTPESRKRTHSHLSSDQGSAALLVGNNVKYQARRASQLRLHQSRRGYLFSAYPNRTELSSHGERHRTHEANPTPKRSVMRPARIVRVWYGPRLNDRMRCPRGAGH